MKLFAIMMLLVGCATAPKEFSQETNDQMCSDFCGDNWGTEKFLFSSQSACVCRTESGIKENFAICVVSQPGRSAQCLVDAYNLCQANDYPGGDPQYFCAKLSQEVGPALHQ